ncbi:Starch-binding associating with outer membrane [Fodinibius roseus]|uniref:Starch-binding associating with outer membrane n=1 Tax=Fodinibius roseus TaxID=1194090 RepID=A0A1M4UNH2_9BACT|nr:RagB/SusD family nutrient uptake outer membrane protein [Fodinibius roseus]SHE58332.1 Starch-binding associating with outer membrane [Fodinibius roseus]
MEKLRCYLVIVVIAMGFLSFSSCDHITGDEFLDRHEKDTPSPEVFFVNEESAQQAVAAAYRPIVRGSFTMYRRDLSNMLDAMSDDSGWRPYIASYISQEQWIIDEDQLYMSSYWPNFYRTINAANYAIEEIPALIDHGVSQEKINNYVGEAHFIRGFAYLFLVNFYGDVPLITETLSSFDEFEQPRASSEEVFSQVIEDLKFAKENLPFSWPSSLQGSATKAAAAAYLAKAYLYREDYSSAETAARDAINIAEESGHYLVDDYESIFDINNEGNPELLFYFTFVEEPSGQHTGATINRIPSNNPPEFDIFGVSGRAYNLPQRDLYDAYEEEDPRRDYTLWTPGDDFGVYQGDEPYTYTHQTYNENGEQISYDKTYTAGDTIEYDYRWSETGMNYKKLIYNIGHLADVRRAGMDEPQMRMADLYLILAEALAEQGNNEAMEWVNAVRSRASVNMPPKDPAKYGGLVGAVRHERRVELAGEGQRLWDLIRWNELKNIFHSDTAVKCHFFSDYLPEDESWKYDDPELENYPSEEILFPIPLDEIDQNSAIDSQNPGY